MNDYGGIELIKVQEDIYKVPENEMGVLKDVFCVDKDNNFSELFFVKIGSRTVKLVKKLPSPDCKVFAYLK